MLDPALLTNLNHHKSSFIDSSTKNEKDESSIRHKTEVTAIYKDTFEKYRPILANLPAKNHNKSSQLFP